MAKDIDYFEAHSRSHQIKLNEQNESFKTCLEHEGIIP
jgi:hypothetical protein